MKSVIEKEKKLNLALTKLKNLNLNNPDIKKNIENLSVQKNQLEIELLSKSKIRFLSFKCPARLRASWLIPSIKQPSPAKT